MLYLDAACPDRLPRLEQLCIPRTIINNTRPNKRKLALLSLPLRTLKQSDHKKHKSTDRPLYARLIGHSPLTIAFPVDANMLLHDTSHLLVSDTSETQHASIITGESDPACSFTGNMAYRDAMRLQRGESNGILIRRDTKRLSLVQPYPVTTGILVLANLPDGAIALKQTNAFALASAPSS